MDQNEGPPRAHRISFNDDNTIQLGLHTPLDDDLVWSRVSMWLPADEEWSVVSIDDSFWLPVEYDTILLRLPGSVHALGMGREIHALECVHKRPEQFGEAPFLTNENVCGYVRRRPTLTQL